MKEALEWWNSLSRVKKHSKALDYIRNALKDYERPIFSITRKEIVIIYKRLKMKKNINWDKIKPGTTFAGYINTIPTIGKIQKEGGDIFLCQNTQNGAAPSDTLSFDYGWCISGGSDLNLQSNSVIIEAFNINKTYQFNELEFNEDYRLNEKKLTINLNNGLQLNCILNPFNNCQNMTMKSAYKILNFDDKSLIKLIKILLSYKNVLIIDIERKYEGKLSEDKFSLLFKTNYTNTTGTDMTIVGINLVHTFNKLLENNQN